MDPLFFEMRERDHTVVRRGDCGVRKVGHDARPTWGTSNDGGAGGGTAQRPHTRGPVYARHPELLRAKWGMENEDHNRTEAERNKEAAGQHPKGLLTISGRITRQEDSRGEAGVPIIGGGTTRNKDESRGEAGVDRSYVAAARRSIPANAWELEKEVERRYTIDRGRWRREGQEGNKEENTIPFGAITKGVSQERFPELKFTSKDYEEKEGVPVIRLDREEYQAAISRLDHSLVLKFQHRRPSLREMTKVLDCSWRIEGRVTISPIWDDRHAVMILDSEKDANTILTSPIRKIGQSMFRIFRWKPELSPHWEDSVVTKWVRFPNLPLQITDRAIIKAMVKPFASLVDIDERTKNLTGLRFARACVEVDVLRKIPKRVWIDLPNKMGFFQDIVMEGNVEYCTACRKHGHHSSECRSTARTDLGCWSGNERPVGAIVEPTVEERQIQIQTRENQVGQSSQEQSSQSKEYGAPEFHSEGWEMALSRKNKRKLKRLKARGKGEEDLHIRKRTNGQDACTKKGRNQTNQGKVHTKPIKHRECLDEIQEEPMLRTEEEIKTSSESNESTILKMDPTGQKKGKQGKKKKRSKSLGSSLRERRKDRSGSEVKSIAEREMEEDLWEDDMTIGPGKYNGLGLCWKDKVVQNTEPIRTGEIIRMEQEDTMGKDSSRMEVETSEDSNRPIAEWMSFKAVKTRRKGRSSSKAGRKAGQKEKPMGRDSPINSEGTLVEANGPEAKGPENQGPRNQGVRDASQCKGIRRAGKEDGTQRPRATSKLSQPGFRGILRKSRIRKIRKVKGKESREGVKQHLRKGVDV